MARDFGALPRSEQAAVGQWSRRDYARRSNQSLRNSVVPCIEFRPPPIPRMTPGFLWAKKSPPPGSGAGVTCD